MAPRNGLEPLTFASLRCSTNWATWVTDSNLLTSVKWRPFRHSEEVVRVGRSRTPDLRRVGAALCLWATLAQWFKCVEGWRMHVPFIPMNRTSYELAGFPISGSAIPVLINTDPFKRWLWKLTNLRASNSPSPYARDLHNPQEHTIVASMSRIWIRILRKQIPPIEAKEQIFLNKVHKPSVSVQHFSPDYLRREISRWVSCYAIFEWWLLLSLHPHCYRNFTTLSALNVDLGTLNWDPGCFPFDEWSLAPTV